MKESISCAYMVLNENNCLFKASLESTVPRFDEVIIIDGGSDDGTLKLIDSFNESKITVIHNKWKGNDGFQRNQYLKYANGDWIFVIDADEVLGDNGIELYNYAGQDRIDCFDIHMIHFIWHLGLRDASTGGHLPKDESYEHFVPRRFFRNQKNLYYPTREHTVVQGHNSFGRIEDITLYHYSDARGMFMKVIPQSYIDMKRAKIHTKDYMKWWRESRLFGTYPVKPFVGQHPSSIRRLIEGKP